MEDHVCVLNGKGGALNRCGFRADDIVSFDDGGDAHARVAVLDARLDAENLPQCTHQNFRTASNFRRQSQD